MAAKRPNSVLNFAVDFGWILAPAFFQGKRPKNCVVHLTEAVLVDECAAGQVLDQVRQMLSIAFLPLDLEPCKTTQSYACASQCLRP